MEISKWKTDCRQFDEIVMNDLRIKLTTPIGNNSSLDFIDLNQNQIKENTNTKSLFRMLIQSATRAARCDAATADAYLQRSLRT
ncbi:hypothetical protein [Comamonas sp. C24C]